MFVDANGKARIVRGVGLASGSPRLAELAARVGFETVWIDMEHGPTSFERAEAICQAVEAGGGFGTIRVADAQRSSVLRALEVGARVVVVPMIETAEQAADVARAGKFPPRGERGFNTRSRGVGFGLAPALEAFARADAETHLFVQIETARGVKNLDRILAVPGLSGILLGPGDLSASVGAFGDMKSEALVRTCAGCVARARAAGRHAGVYVSPGPLLDAAMGAGADLVFAGGDVGALAKAWTQLLAELAPPPAPASRGVRADARSRSRRRRSGSGR